jgi:hypothetical protein
VRRVLVEQLKPGDRIGRDVYADPGGLPLLKAGIRVSDSYRESLKRAGIPAVRVDDRLSQGIEPLEVLSDQTKRLATAAIRDAFRDAQDKLRRDDVVGRLPPLGVGLLVHDIGQLAVPPEILQKPGPLTEDERLAMKQHRSKASASCSTRRSIRCHARWCARTTSIVLDAAGAVITPHEIDLATSDGLTIASADFDPGTIAVEAEP